MSCSDFPTKADALRFKKNAGTINEIVTSKELVTSPAIDGEKKFTLKGLTDKFIFRNVGEYSDNPLIQEFPQFVTDNGEVYFPTAYPHQVKSSSYPNASDDPNLTLAQSDNTSLITASGTSVTKTLSDWEKENLLGPIAKTNNVRLAQVAILQTGAVNGISYFYDLASEKVLYSPTAITGDVTDIDSSPGYSVTITVSGVEHTLNANVISNDNRYTATFKNDEFGSAVENMIAGRIDGVSSVSVSIGGVYSTTGGSWERVSDASGDITDFVSLTNVHISDFGKLGSGANDNDILTSAMLTGRSINIKEGDVLTIDPTAINLSTCKGLHGLGKLVFTKWAIREVPDNFFIANLEVECQAAFGIHFTTGANCRFTKLRFNNTANAANEWHHAMRLIDMPRVHLSKINTYNCGLWLRDCRDIDVSGLYIDVNKAGLGVGEAGGDCLKLTSQTTGNLTNMILLNASRDGIDMFTSGRDINLTNFVISNPTTHGIEIKVGIQTNPNDFPRKINISNFTIQNGAGEKGANNVAGIIIKSDNQSNPIKASGIHISNGSIQDLGKNALSGGNVSGIRAEYVKGLAIIGVTIKNILNSTVSGSDSVGYGIYLTNCNDVVISSCPNIHGEYRGILASRCIDLSISGGTVGRNSETEVISSIGLVVPSSGNKVKINSTTVYGSTRSLSTEGSDVTNLSVSDCTLEGYAYLDAVIKSSFVGTTFKSDDDSGDMVSTASGTCKSIKFSACDFDGGNRSLRLANSLTSVIGCSFHNSKSTHISINEGKGLISGCDYGTGSPLVTTTGAADYTETDNFTQ